MESRNEVSNVRFGVLQSRVMLKELELFDISSSKGGGLTLSMLCVVVVDVTRGLPEASDCITTATELIELYLPGISSALTGTCFEALR